MADSTIPNLTEKSAAVGTDVIYITDGINDYQITLQRIFNFINANITGITETQISLADNTTNNSSTAKHGFVPKLPNDATKFYNGVGGFAIPAGITNSAGDNIIPKSNGTNLVASRISDDGINAIDFNGAASDGNFGGFINPFNSRITFGNGTGTYYLIDDNAGLIEIETLTGLKQIKLQTLGIVNLGDKDSVGNNTLLEINDFTQLITSTKPIQVNNAVILKDADGNQLLAHQTGGVTDPSGGVVQDTECRAALVGLLTKLRVHGLIAT